MRSCGIRVQGRSLKAVLMLRLLLSFFDVSASTGITAVPFFVWGLQGWGCGQEPQFTTRAHLTTRDSTFDMRTPTLQLDGRPQGALRSARLLHCMLVL